MARIDYRPGARCEMHRHDFAELFFLEAGRGVHPINGERTTIEAGDVVLIRPDDEHGFAAPRGGAGFTMVNLAFEADVLSHIRDRYFGGRRRWPGAGAKRPAAWRVDEAGLRRLTDLLLPLSTGGRRRLDLESFLLSALQLLTADPHAGAGRGGPPPWLGRAITEFTAHGDLSAGAAGLVALAGRSTEHVNRTVRRCLGQTTTELVNTIRLDRAAHLLRMTGRPIVGVALDSGFENLGYFYRRFAQRFGTTPRRFRRAAQAVAR